MPKEAARLEREYRITTTAVSYTWMYPDVTFGGSLENQPYDVISINKEVLTILGCSYEDFARQFAEERMIGVPSHCRGILGVERDDLVFRAADPFANRDDVLVESE
jgi:hypothetical protein